MRSIRREKMYRAAVSALVLACPMLAEPALANPQGGQVVGGQATISGSGATVQIDQSTKVVVIDWNSFNIAQGETTVFNQPGATAMAVNRIGGADPSQILGNLSANGRVVLINGNGILFGPNAKINVGSLVATTMDASNADLMSGKATFSGNSTATVENRGSITAASGGMVGLIAGAVSNSGVISAKLGSVTLGASRQFTLDFTGDGLVSFPVDGQVLARAVGSNGQPVQALVVNQGRIEGATVLLSAQAAQNLVQTVVDMSGVITATGVHNEGGAIVLDGGDGGVAVSGGLDASASHGAGGSVSVAGGAISLTGATINAIGASGGGSVTLGGWTTASLLADAATVIDASATDNGAGGHVSVIAELNSFSGSIAARGGANGGDGGDVETSGDLLSVAGARIDTLAPYGKAGDWLLDPYTVEICGPSTAGGCTTSGYSFPNTTTDGSVSKINVSDLVRDLATTNVTIAAHGQVVGGSEGSTSTGSTTTGSTTTGSGNPTTGGNPSTSGGGTTGGNPTDPPSDITVLTPISWSAPTVLELGASDAISIQKPITIGGGGGLVLGDATDVSLQPTAIKINAAITFTGTAGPSSALTLDTAPTGSITQTAAITVPVLQGLGGKLALTNPGNQIATLAGWGGALNLTDASALQVTGPVSGSNVTLTSGGTVTETGGGAITATGALSVTSVGGASLTGANRAASVALTNTGGGAVSYAGAQGLRLRSAANAGGPLNLTANNGSMTLIGAVNAGAVTLDSAGAITESGSGVINATSLAGTSTGSVKLGGANEITTLDAFSVTAGAFTLSNAEALEVGGALSAKNVSLSSAGALTVASGGPITASGALALTTTSGAIAIDDSVSGFRVTLDSAAGISETGAGAIATSYLMGSAAGAVTLGGANHVNELAGFTVTGGDFSLTDGHALGVEDILDGSGQTVSLTTTAGQILVEGTIKAATLNLDAQAGPLNESASLGAIKVGTLNATAQAGIDLASPSNQIGAVGTDATTSGPNMITP